MARSGMYVVDWQAVARMLHARGMAPEHLELDERTLKKVVAGEPVLKCTRQRIADDLGVGLADVPAAKQGGGTVPWPARTRTIRVVIEEDYSPELVDRTVAVIIREAPEDSDIEVNLVKRGSTIIEFEMSAANADAILAAFAAGRLAGLGVTDVREVTPGVITGKVRHVAGESKDSGAEGVEKSASDPWEVFERTHIKGQWLEGPVTMVGLYGCFVELAPGVSGLISATEIEELKSPSLIIGPHSVGKMMRVRINHILPEYRFVSLTLKPDPSPPSSSSDPGITAEADELTTAEPRAPSTRGRDKEPDAQFQHDFPEGSVIKGVIGRIERSTMSAMLVLGKNMSGVLHVADCPGEDQQAKECSFSELRIGSSLIVRVVEHAPLGSLKPTRVSLILPSSRLPSTVTYSRPTAG